MFNLNYFGDFRQCNGFDEMIVISAKNMESFLKDFIDLASPDKDPNELIKYVLRINNLSENDFTQEDLDAINIKIKEIYDAF